MTTALLKQALDCLELLKNHPNIEIWCDSADKTITAIRDYLKREEALQRMVDTSQELGLYDTTHALQPTYAGRAVTTTVTDPAEIRKVFELDADADYQPPADSGFAKL